MMVSNSTWVARIDSARQLDAAREVLYKVYGLEQGWQPPTDNPSGQRCVRLGSGAWGFVDDYDLTSTWLGLFAGDRVVGCLRLIDRRINGGRLELENYLRLPNTIIAYGPDLLEINRLAIDPEYRGGHGALALIAEAQRHTLERRCRALAAMVPSTARIAVRYGGMTDSGLTFKYHADDPEPAHLLVQMNPVQMERHLYGLRTRLLRLARGVDAMRSG
jgi:hypothetical protein